MKNSKMNSRRSRGSDSGSESKKANAKKAKLKAKLDEAKKAYKAAKKELKAAAAAAGIELKVKPSKKESPSKKETSAGGGRGRKPTAVDMKSFEKGMKITLQDDRKGVIAKIDRANKKLVVQPADAKRTKTVFARHFEVKRGKVFPKT